MRKRVVMYRLKTEILRTEKKLFGTYVYINKIGIWFYYKGDEVGYIYPWNRDWRPEKRFYSVSFICGYPSLKTIDDEWDGYFKAEGGSNELSTNR